MRWLPALPVIGFLSATSPEANADIVHALRQGLKEIGYVERENVSIEYRWAENQIDKLPALAAELVRQQVAVILAIASSAALAARAADAYHTAGTGRVSATRIAPTSGRVVT